MTPLPLTPSHKIPFPEHFSENMKNFYTAIFEQTQILQVAYFLSIENIVDILKLASSDIIKDRTRT